MRAETERSVESYLKKRVVELGGLSYKFTSPAHRGVPDRIVVYKGAVLFVEVKTSGGKRSRLQESTQRDLEHHGAVVRVVWSKNDVDLLLAAPPFAPAKRGRPRRAATD